MSWHNPPTRLGPALVRNQVYEPGVHRHNNNHDLGDWESSQTKKMTFKEQTATVVRMCGSFSKSVMNHMLRETGLLRPAGGPTLSELERNRQRKWRKRGSVEEECRRETRCWEESKQCPGPGMCLSSQSEGTLTGWYTGRQPHANGFSLLQVKHSSIPTTVLQSQIQSHSHRQKKTVYLGTLFWYPEGPEMCGPIQTQRRGLRWSRRQ